MVELYSTQSRLDFTSLPQRLLFNRIIAGRLQPAIGWLTLSIVLLSSSAVKAQSAITPNPPGAADAPVSIPVEAAPQAQPDSAPASITDTPPERTIQVPNIVPIPPRPIPSGPLAPLPEATSGTPAPSEDSYVLGSGDQIVVNVFDVPEFSGTNGTYTILVDGTVSFPWIGSVRLQGLTLSQAATRLEREYSSKGYLQDPLITLNLVAPRNLMVNVVGQVKRPGAYSIAPAGGTSTPALGTTENAGGGGTGGQWPTITQAIQTAQGITQLADLRNVQVRRALPNGTEQLINANLWELIRSGQTNQDITLRDGDTIIVPTAVSISPDEALLTGSASFAPATVQVNVVGQVINPGPIEVPPNTPLNQALQAAGGFDQQRAKTSSVQLIRLNPNGTAVRRTIDVDLAAGINEESNPPLQAGDTIIVRRNGFTSVTDTVGAVLNPLGSILGWLNFFGLDSNNNNN